MLEDVHMNIESALVERIGEVGKKLHTGRSRNDQVATDLRLYLRDEVDGIVAQLVGLMTVLVDIAEQQAETIMPGFTHLQAAQPVTFGHQACRPLQRDAKTGSTTIKRLPQAYKLHAAGSAALAGNEFSCQQGIHATILGFEDICSNSRCRQ